ncbi:MAG: CopG family transcriptional regulator [Cyanobacteria bacterium]|jgi:hypothetical protein|nr:CopG family transcriptional regulator [Cyanobacteria bacterium GSL.Bin1]
MKAEEFDRKFDNNEDITPFLDLSLAHRPGNEPQAITLNLPQWMLEAIDQQAQRLGVTRESIIKVWLAQRLEASKNA